VRFRLGDGKDCVISEHGIAQVPGFTGIPNFNLEEALATADEFLLEPIAPNARVRTVKREELSALANDSPMAAAAVDHDDE
jgi:hypothetical protein